MGILSKFPGRLQMVWQAQNTSWKSVPSFSIRAEYTTAFKCPHRKNLINWGSSNLGAEPRKHTLIWICSGVGNAPLKFVQTLKLTTCLNVVLRLRVAVVWKIPVFGMTPHSETWTSYVPWIYPNQFLHYIFTMIINWQIAVTWSYFNWRFVGRKCLPVTTDTSSAVFVSVWHISFAVTCGVTRLSYKQWSSVATWR
jgi:hypothetical protein